MKHTGCTRPLPYNIIKYIKEVYMKNDNYIPRIIDEEIKKYLAAFGSVCIVGPKLCGKTSTGLSKKTRRLHLQAKRYVPALIRWRWIGKYYIDKMILKILIMKILI